MEVIISIFELLIIFIIIKIRDNNNEKRIINLVLSKLDFCPNHYKIIRNDNKIIIKCHHYSKEWSKLLFKSESPNIIKQNKDGFYICCDNIKLINYDPNKNLGIISYDI